MVAQAILRAIVLSRPGASRASTGLARPARAGPSVFLCLLSAALVGLAPAFTLGPARGRTGRPRTSRRSLVAAEFAIAIVLLSGAGLFLRSLWNLQSVDQGFRPDRVLVVAAAASRAASMRPRSRAFKRCPVSRAPRSSATCSPQAPVSRPSPPKARSPSRYVSAATRSATVSSARSPRPFSAAASSRPATAATSPRSRSSTRPWPAASGLWPTPSAAVSAPAPVPGSPSSAWSAISAAKARRPSPSHRCSSPSCRTRPGARHPRPFHRRRPAPARARYRSGRARGRPVGAGLRDHHRRAPTRRLPRSPPAPDDARRRFLRHGPPDRGDRDLRPGAVFGDRAHSRDRHPRRHRRAGGEFFLLILREGMTLGFAGLCVGMLAALALSRAGASLLFGVVRDRPIDVPGGRRSAVGGGRGSCYFPARRAMKLDPVRALRLE